MNEESLKDILNECYQGESLKIDYSFLKPMIQKRITYLLTAKQYIITSLPCENKEIVSLIENQIIAHEYWLKQISLKGIKND